MSMWPKNQNFLKCGWSLTAHHLDGMFPSGCSLTHKLDLAHQIIARHSLCHGI